MQRLREGGLLAVITPMPLELAVFGSDGGSHAQFGHCGPQAGDGIARIDRDEQQRQTAETVLTFLRALR